MLTTSEQQYQPVTMPGGNSNGASSDGVCGGLVNKTTREWFRSAEMEYVSLGVQEHCAHRVVADLGRLGVIQFTDVSIGCVSDFLSSAVARCSFQEVTDMSLL
jgi:hypothetical protein